MIFALGLFDENLQLIEAIESFLYHVKGDNDFFAQTSAKLKPGAQIPHN